MAKKEDIITDNAAELEIPPSPFEGEETDDREPPKTRTELETMTAKELAVLAAPYMDGITVESIAKWAKKDIITVILKGGRPEKKPTARQSQTKSEAAQMIDDLIALLDVTKIEREQSAGAVEAKPNPTLLKGAFRNNAVNILDEKVQNGSFNLHGASYLVAGVCAVLLTWNTFVGIKNTGAFIKSVKEKLGKKNADAADKKQ